MPKASPHGGRTTDPTSDWSHIYLCWQERLSDFNVKPDPLFKTMILPDPKCHMGRGHELTWCPKDAVQKLQLDAQRHLTHSPGTKGLINFGHEFRGEETTLNYLWRDKDDPEQVAAILMIASLFYRGGSTRTCVPPTWTLPDKKLIKFRNCVYDKWLGDGHGRGWSPWNTVTLPYHSDDRDCEVANVDNLIRYFAEEHAALLRTYVPIVVEYGAQPDPLIQLALKVENNQRKLDDEQWRSAQDLRRHEEAIHELALRTAHPRYGEWGILSRAELEQLVWTKPTTHIAHEFGVSDVLIGKACKRSGIAKPPVGFWSKVASGKLPHPCGKPVE